MQKSKPSDPNTYTKPELRDKIKSKIVAGEKGGNPGQWSARKAQLVAQEYEREGGGYKKPRSTGQKSLKQWEDEHWTTSDGKKARRKEGTVRYLPEKAWKELSPEQRSATNQKKLEGCRKGKQFVGNTETAARARKKASGAVARKRKAPTPAAASKSTTSRKRSAAVRKSK